MKTRYDPEADALFVRLAEGRIEDTEEVAPGVMLDFDAEGRIAAVEFLKASERTTPGALPIAVEEGRFFKRVSIHAPVRERRATSSASVNPASFQSTLP